MSDLDDTKLTELLGRLHDGEPGVLDQLIPLVYDELRILARKQLRGEAPGHTLQTTALVNEAYAKLAGERRIGVSNRNEFFGVASHAMRRVLVDYARKRKAKKRGQGAEHISLDEAEAFLGEREAEEVLALDTALDRLAKLSPRASEVVQHRFFAGLTLKETAELLEVSTRTAQRDWDTALAWLQREIESHMSLLRSL